MQDDISFCEEHPDSEFCRRLYKESLHSQKGTAEGLKFDVTTYHSFIIFGASGDLASKKIYPTLWWLYRDKFLPTKMRFLGYARSNLTTENIRDNCISHANVKSGEEQTFQKFWALNDYICGQYASNCDMERLNETIKEYEEDGPGNRIFYLAVPSIVFESITVLIKAYCMSTTGWTRVIIEKPHGRDLMSSNALISHINCLFKEEEIYRIDHYLGKEMIQSLIGLRFGNQIFGPAWNKDSIACVRITLKETEDVGLRGRYFDEYGIIRDITQNHLLQVLALLAMEQPLTCLSNDIRNEKVKVLKAIKPVEFKDVLLGQYIGNPEGTGMQKNGYRDAQYVREDSTQPTFAMAVLYVDNERWEGVPFILTCGKALNEKIAEVRIQFRNVARDIFFGKTRRNELVIRVQPNEATYLKVMIKSPGVGFDIEESELDLTYSTRYAGIKLPDAYERLLLDVFCGLQVHFVRCDEMTESWRIFTPLLNKIELEKIKPVDYVYGSRGPEGLDELLLKNNFYTYKWNKK